MTLSGHRRFVGREAPFGVFWGGFLEAFFLVPSPLERLFCRTFFGGSFFERSRSWRRRAAGVHGLRLVGQRAGSRPGLAVWAGGCANSNGASSSIEELPSSSSGPVAVEMPTW